MPKQKWRNRVLERGVLIDRSRGYVYVRFKRQGLVRKELIGRTTDADVIDRANFRAQSLRQERRSQVPGFAPRPERVLVQDAADLFLRRHGEKRDSRRGVKQFIRYVRLIKDFWAGRYVDTLSSDDMRDYRQWRRQGGGSASQRGVSESTINREHTAITTMFNRLAEWRRAGRVARNILLPESNPGRGVRKCNEDRFIRERLLTDVEFQKLLSCANEKVRRIILAEMNLPLRLEDLKGLTTKNIRYKLNSFTGTQAKTGKEYTLPINSTMWELIRTAKSERLLDFTGFVRGWRSAVRLAGLKNLQFRDLRRTAATALHDKGVSLRTISAMLGHSAVTTTIRYLGLRQENLAVAGEMLAAKYRAPIGGEDVESVPKSVPSSFTNEIVNAQRT